MRGQAPLTPRAVGFFFYAAEVRSTTMLHGASPDEAMSADGSIAIRCRSPFLVF
jgi:hypothetical protein